LHQETNHITQARHENHHTNRFYQNRRRKGTKKLKKLPRQNIVKQKLSDGHVMRGYSGLNALLVCSGGWLVRRKQEANPEEHEQLTLYSGCRTEEKYFEVMKLAEDRNT